MATTAGRAGVDCIAGFDPKRCTGALDSRRSRSWTPPSLADAATSYGEEDDSDDGASVLFDKCRFPRPAEDLLDCVLGEEPWQAATEASDQRQLRIVGEVGALKRLFSLPLRSAGEAVCIHRIGDCLIALEVPNDARGPDDYAASTCATAATYSAKTMRSQVRVEGDMIRVYPRMDSAEAVDIDPPQGSASHVAACCEWRVREGLSLLAVTPQLSLSGSSPCDLVDLRSRPPRLMNQEHWRGSDPGDFSSITGIDMKSAHWPTPPAYHTRVTESHAVVRAVNIPESLDTDDLVDAWLSCCLNGSPSLLCFFVDAQGICRGCRHVAAADIPMLSRIAKEFHPGRRCLESSPRSGSAATDPSSEELGLEAFDPRALRETSHSLLETLIDRVGDDGGQCLVIANPLGIHFLNASLHGRCEEDSDSGDAEEKPATRMLMDAPELIPGFERKSFGTPTKSSEQKDQEEFDQAYILNRLHRAHMTQALLLYHAAVRLASPRLPQGSAPDGVKDVPVGSRWSAKSCCHPLRVRQMMLHAVRALRAAIAVKESKERDESADTAKASFNVETTGAPPVRWRFLLLLASAFEFLADTFLAEDTHGDEGLDVARQLSALRHLHKSTTALGQYMEYAKASDALQGFTQSVQRLEERVLAKRANAHLCLARLRQRQSWSDSAPGFRTTGSALRELDVAEQLLLKPPRVAQPPRPSGPHECSLLASIAKWKADLLFEFVSLSKPSTLAGTDVDNQLKEYLESQQAEVNEPLLPLPLQTERWLQSIVSLSLRSLHHLASVPQEIVGELQAQARAVLARAYGDLGHIYASTGRYTKAMTHAKQGIELFSATHDKLHAAMLQLWLCRLQLRLAVPQASAAGDSILDESALFKGLSAASSAEDSACGQVVSSLQRVLKSLEGAETEDRIIQTQIQALLGRVILRQGLSRMARVPPFCAVCGLCEEDSVLASVLELAQGGEPVSMDEVRDAVELLLQASSYFRDAGERRLNAVAHACLAASYFRGRLDVRLQRLATTHCQHALEHLQDAGGSSVLITANVDDASPLQLAVQLLEAKTMRRENKKGSAPSSSSRNGDASAAAALCSIAMTCLQVGRSRESRLHSPKIGPEDSRPPTSAGDGVEFTAMPRTVLAGHEQREPFESYVRQELADLVLRLLRSNDRQEGAKRDLKSFYGTLLTASHTDTGQAHALRALRDYLQNMENSSS